MDCAWLAVSEVVEALSAVGATRPSPVGDEAVDASCLDGAAPMAAVQAGGGIYIAAGWLEASRFRGKGVDTEFDDLLAPTVLPRALVGMRELSKMIMLAKKMASG